ncbi:hypothetical protein ONE63_010368 [Megalurothrips usitatus]|uniref:ATP-dependent DNA helicase n=1 Tax=Megalurothrips usitatus TaxID=439358 RepID=A0AAV7XMB7_9NEOP|nr:hypothetical protein ONE63_010368 [Megalurothrips usitatus]
MLLRDPGAQSLKLVGAENGVFAYIYRQRDVLNELRTYNCSPSSRRFAFALVIRYIQVEDVTGSWELIKYSVIGDFVNKYSMEPDEAIDEALKHIWSIFHGWGAKEGDYDFPYVQPDPEPIPLLDISFPSRTETLNEKQRMVYDAVMAAAMDCTNTHPLLLYVKGAGGTGKSHLFTVLGEDLQRAGLLSMYTAFSGVATQVLPFGRTCHTGYGIPKTRPVLGKEPLSNIGLESDRAARIHASHVHFIDEISMLKEWHFQVINQILQDIMFTENRSRPPFGNKVVVIGGDFRQTSPIVSKDEGSVIEESVYAHQHFKLFKCLDENMRASEDPVYAEYLQTVADGSANEPGSRKIIIPKGLLQNSPKTLKKKRRGRPKLLRIRPFQHHNDLSDLVTAVFRRGGGTDMSSGEEAFLAPTNENCDMVNVICDIALSRVQSDLKLFDSHSVFENPQNINEGIETSEEDEFALTIPDALAAKVVGSSLPPHELKLKKDAIVMVPRNLSLPMGIVIGTVARVTNIGINMVTMLVLTGKMKGEEVVLPRIRMEDDEVAKPKIAVRYQIPLRLAYAYTIHRAQSRTLKKVGLYLPKPVFAHGMLYVALSRARRLEDLHLLIEDGPFQGRVTRDGRSFGEVATMNIVDAEVLELV